MVVYKQKIRNAIFHKQRAGGGIVTDMLPQLFLLLFGAILILLVLDSYSAVTTKQDADRGLAVFADEMMIAQNLNDDLKQQIEDYLHNEFGVDKTTIDFTGSSGAVPATDSVILKIKCQMPSGAINKILPEHFVYSYSVERKINDSIY